MLSSANGENFTAYFLIVVMLLHLDSMVETVPRARARANMSLVYNHTRSISEPENYKQNFNDVGVENSTVWITSCRRYKRGKNCTLDIYNNSMDIDADQHFNFYLETRTSTSQIAPYLRVFHLSNGTFLVTWIESDKHTPIDVEHVDNEIIRAAMFVNFIIIDSSSGSQSKAISTTGSILRPGYLDPEILGNNLAFHLYDDAFSVFYFYTENRTIAQEIYNVGGHLIYGPVKSVDFQIFEKPKTLATYPRKFGTDECYGLIRSQERLRIQLDLLNDTFASHPRKLPGKSQHTYSTANGNISSCRVIDEDSYSWNCSQGEWGRKSNEMILTFDHISDDLVIFNMPGGGLLTLTRKKKDYFHDLSEYQFYLTKFDTKSRAYESSEFEVLHCTKSVLFAHFFQDKAGKFCLTLVYKYLNFRITTKCYQ
ncbi:hypothetical protein QAD02_012102 [Eretmocerus hayati]|uniref:Uncharacterized protein n=1 Tax=Eretmocerus hayati TaxID=131215 RepID=A0ACC2NYE9_9HYME|nr:hypothetical protein QAD02_012102 [Eretmocerus hayati]